MSSVHFISFLDFTYHGGKNKNQMHDSQNTTNNEHQQGTHTWHGYGLGIRQYIKVIFRKILKSPKDQNYVKQ